MLVWGWGGGRFLMGWLGDSHTLIQMAAQWMCDMVGLVAWGAWEVLLGQEERTLFLHHQDLSYREVGLKGSFGASWCLEVGTVIALLGGGDSGSLSHRRLLNTKMSNLYLRLQKSIYWKGCPWPV